MVGVSLPTRRIVHRRAWVASSATPPPQSSSSLRKSESVPGPSTSRLFGAPVPAMRTERIPDMVWGSCGSANTIRAYFLCRLVSGPWCDARVESRDHALAGPPSSGNPPKSNVCICRVGAVYVVVVVVRGNMCTRYGTVVAKLGALTIVESWC